MDCHKVFLGDLGSFLVVLGFSWVLLGHSEIFSGSSRCYCVVVGFSANFLGGSG